MNKKSQTWTTEFMLAFLIFSSAAIISVKLISTIYQNNNFGDLMKESETISENLFSDGYPSNWTNATVFKVGFLTNHSIDTRKLQQYYILSYSNTKRLMGVNKNYYVAFRNKDNSLSLFNTIGATSDPAAGCGYGHPAVVATYVNSHCVLDFSALDYKDFVKFSRFVVYNTSVIAVDIYSWS
jgi:hypothetical protein